MSKKAQNLDGRIAQIRGRLAELEEERRRLTAELTRLNREEELQSTPQVVREPDSSSAVHKLSSSDEKIRLFRSLFRGREDVYPRRWESAKTGRSGYSPACRNEWVPGICEKPKVKCGDCSVRDLLPVTDAAIRDHLVGHGQSDQSDFTIGVYPLLPDETCWFFAVDFEGFDDHRLDTLFLTMPISWKGTLAQYVGRLHRLHHGKTEVVVYDYVDRFVPTLTRMAERRFRGYRSLGYEFGEDTSTS